MNWFVSARNSIIPSQKTLTIQVLQQQQQIHSLQQQMHEQKQKYETTINSL